MKVNTHSMGFQFGETSDGILSNTRLEQYQFGVNFSLNAIHKNSGSVEKRLGTEYICPAFFNENTRIASFGSFVCVFEKMQDDPPANNGGAYFVRGVNLVLGSNIKVTKTTVSTVDGKETATESETDLIINGTANYYQERFFSKDNFSFDKEPVEQYYSIWNHPGTVSTLPNDTRRILATSNLEYATILKVDSKLITVKYENGKFALQYLFFDNTDRNYQQSKDAWGNKYLGISPATQPNHAWQSFRHTQTAPEDVANNNIQLYEGVTKTPLDIGVGYRLKNNKYEHFGDPIATFFEGRVIVSDGVDIHMSALPSVVKHTFDDFSGGTDATSSVSIDGLGHSYGHIKALGVLGTNLIIGTNHAIISLTNTSANGIIIATNFVPKIRIIAQYSVSQVTPVRYGDILVFVGTDGQTLISVKKNELTPYAGGAELKANLVTPFQSASYTNGEIIKLKSFHTKDTVLILALTTSGNVLAYNGNSSFACSRWVFGDGVKDICVMNDAHGDDLLYLVVERAGYHYIEVMSCGNVGRKLLSFFDEFRYNEFPYMRRFLEYREAFYETTNYMDCVQKRRFDKVDVNLSIRHDGTVLANAPLFAPEDENCLEILFQDTSFGVIKYIDDKNVTVAIPHGFKGLELPYGSYKLLSNKIVSHLKDTPFLAFKGDGDFFSLLHNPHADSFDLENAKVQSYSIGSPYSFLIRTNPIVMPEADRPHIPRSPTDIHALTRFTPHLSFSGAHLGADLVYSSSKPMSMYVQTYSLYPLGNDSITDINAVSWRKSTALPAKLNVSAITAGTNLPCSTELLMFTCATDV